MRNGRDIVQIRAMVMLPLYRKGYAAKTREEELRIAALENRNTSVSNQLAATVERAFISYEQARLNHLFYQKQLTLIGASSSLLETQYSTGRTNFEAVRQIELQQLDYELRLLESVVNSHLAINEMSRLAKFE